MTATSHAVIGTVIAAKVGNPALAVPLALASHILADFFPHWDTGTNGTKNDRKKVFVKTFFDVIIGFILSYLMIQFLFPKTDLLYAFSIIMVSQSLDWITAPYYFFNIKSFKWVYDFQKSFDNRLGMPWGIINQVIALTFIIILAKKF